MQENDWCNIKVHWKVEGNIRYKKCSHKQHNHCSRSRQSLELCKSLVLFVALEAKIRKHHPHVHKMLEVLVSHLEP